MLSEERFRAALWVSWVLADNLIGTKRTSGLTDGVRQLCEVPLPSFSDPVDSQLWGYCPKKRRLWITPGQLTHITGVDAAMFTRHEYRSTAKSFRKKLRIARKDHPVLRVWKSGNLGDVLTALSQRAMGRERKDEYLERNRIHALIQENPPVTIPPDLEYPGAVIVSRQRDIEDQRGLIVIGFRFDETIDKLGEKERFDELEKPEDQDGSFINSRTEGRAKYVRRLVNGCRDGFEQNTMCEGSTALIRSFFLSKRWIAVAVGFIVAIVVLKVVWKPDFSDSSFRGIVRASFEESTLTMTDERGATKNRVFSSTISQVFVADLDGDGRNECFVGFDGGSPDRGTLLLLDSFANPVNEHGWPLVFTIENPYPSISRMGSYEVKDLIVIERGVDRMVVLLVAEDELWRSAIVVLDQHASVHAVLWHPGMLHQVRYQDDNLIVVGQNNHLQLVSLTEWPTQANDHFWVIFSVPISSIEGQAPPFCGTATPNRSFNWYYRLSTPKHALKNFRISDEAMSVRSECGRRFHFDNAGFIGSYNDNVTDCQEDLTLLRVQLGENACPDFYLETIYAQLEQLKSHTD